MWFVIEVSRYVTLQPSFKVVGLHPTQSEALQHCASRNNSFSREKNDIYVVANASSLRAEHLTLATAAPK